MKFFFSSKHFHRWKVEEGSLISDANCLSLYSQEERESIIPCNVLCLCPFSIHSSELMRFLASSPYMHHRE